MPEPNAEGPATERQKRRKTRQGNAHRPKNQRDNRDQSNAKNTHSNTKAPSQQPALLLRPET